MLIHHAQAERVGIGGTLDRRFVVIDQERTGVGAIIAQQAFHQVSTCRRRSRPADRARVAGRTFIETSASAWNGPKRLPMPMASTPMACVVGNGFAHGSAEIRVALSLTAPNTPPCILTIFTAAA